MAARGETQANVEVSTLVVPAWMLRWRAPELALVLGERAVALASTRRDEADRLRAESLVVFAGNRMGRGVRVTDRAIDALKAAEAAGEYETAWLLRVELAACARSVGAPLTGFAAVTPVLEAPDVPAELRASALVQASECLVTVGRGDEPTRALAEADQLYVADATLDHDTRLLLRGLIRAVQAAQHRRWGDLAAAIGAAREGLDLLNRFSDPCADSGQAAGRLTLELVLSLMDANRLLDASEVGAPLLDRPVRAPSASAVGWLRLALATRVHLPAGRVALAREMLREAAVSAERHQLDTVLAESLLALAHVHEVSGELADALTNLRSAHAAERRRARAVYAVRARLAAEFSGVHRQPADLHQQLASVLRPAEGTQVVTDGVLSAALKQQLRQWRPVQVRKGDGLKVKRVRRAAEDMTVEGLSAARQHAADRWRMVQPFGEPDDKTPEAVEPPPAPLPSSSSSSSSDRTVPASGLIASAGAMVSGRRRAARVASGEIDDDRPTTIAEIPITPALTEPEPQQEQPPLTIEQERKRKVEQQLMELQREARRQIEAERAARAEQRAQAEREAQAAEEAARQEAARQEAAREEAARQEAARQEAARREEAARQEAARQETTRQELARQESARQEAVRQEEARREAARQEAVRRDVARQEAAHQEVTRQAVEREKTAKEAVAREEAARAKAAARAEASGSQSESVLDMLKAQGLRAGGRRRARDTEPEAKTPSWRVEPPSGLRQDSPAAEPSQNYFEDSGISARPGYYGDPDSPGRSGLAAAFSHPPAAPDFGPHVDEPAYPLQTPAAGFPAAADPDERKLPDLDFSGLDFGTPKPKPVASIPVPPVPPEAPDPEPEHKPLPDDPIPSVPVPAEIPPAPERDLVSATFLSSADVDDDPSDIPTTPVRVQSQPDQPQPASGAQTSFGTQTTFGTQSFGSQPAFGTQSGFGAPAVHSAQPAYGTDVASPAGQPAELVSPDSDAPTEKSFRAVGEPDPAGDATRTTPASEPPDRSGRPSSRRRPSDLSLADLLAEALVAYETGRRSDEELLEVTDLNSSAWSATPPGPDGTTADQPARPAEAEPPAGADPALRPGESFGAGTDLQAASQPATEATPSSAAYVQPGGAQQASPDAVSGSVRSFGSQQDSAAEAVSSSDALYGAGRPFGAQQDSTADAAASPDELSGSGRRFGAQQDSAGDTPPSSEGLFRPGLSFGAQQDSEAADSRFGSGQRFGSQQDPVAETPASSEGLFRPGSSFGAQHDSPASSDALFGSGQRSGVQQDSAANTSPSADALFGSGQTFGSQQPPAESPEQPSIQESYFLAQPEPESAQEKTGPIAAVPAASDSETTGPIRPFRADGPAGWTLPGA
ncbi:histone H1-like repetitive region-containing protein [Lentzea albidocapillata]|uniref:Histone H1-like nucleoprotein HC2 n=1 Tax=Lentzea albidocapillata TaxID=40571 RepID=A0A1W2FQS3_9PSEU|nr:histone H1-like repetitive region-containing protein [Lentzea albidocapillata]SMD24285.1 Histone H1-like nucleoprotein HC2 [Lentzea albidocapillata]